MTEFMRISYETMERVVFPACSRQAGKRIHQVVVVLDMKGISMTELMSKNAINMSQMATKFVQEYFPEIVFKTIIINAPFLFSGFFNLIKPLMNARTQANLQICGSKYMKDLEALIAPENIPKELGGKCNDPLVGRHYGFYVQDINLSLHLKKWDITDADRNPSLALAAQPPAPAEPTFADDVKDVAGDQEEREPTAEEIAEAERLAKELGGDLQPAEQN